MVRVKSRIRRWLLGLVAVFLVVELVHAGLLFFPQPLFRHKARFDGFTVYANGELPADMVEQMEDGELSLEESLKAFEQGVKLTHECQQALQEAEQKVQLLSEQSGDLVATPFSELEDTE